MLDAHQQAVETTDGAGNRLQAVEDELHEAVYELFELSEEHRRLVEDRILVPEDPLKSKVR
ncbi:hypothetical protein D8S78_12480 [Natrialba swarupiae]|nr:hypothetical protein [Natrialba swarupiae]